jgi:ligand-binding sensor domain-containing protein
MIRDSVYLLVALACASNFVNAQTFNPYSYRLEKVQASSSSVTPLSNSVTDIVISGSTIWLGTGKGLSRSTDNGTTWRNYYNTPEFGQEDVSAIAVHNNEVWVATAHSKDVDGNSLPEGSGLRYSIDGGETWTILPQPRDTKNIDTLFYNAKSRIRALGVTTNVNNITYDIAATDSAVWITSYAGMARKSTDKGKTWEVVILPPDRLDHISPTDSLVFDVSPVGGGLGLENNLNHRAFSVYAENSSNIWIGTAGGINKTTDGGRSWVKFNHKNQAAPISGNFVVALRSQSFAGQKIIWAGTVNAEGLTEKRGVSFSQDSGQTWKTALLGEFCHNIGIRDSVVYIVTDNGIFRTSDVGQTWTQPGTIYDKITRQRIASQKFYSVDASGDNVWFGGNDGLASTLDNNNNPFGFTWKVLHASQPLSSNRTTYAYPNPFSPDDEVVRLHYSTENRTAKVTIRIFDFGMNLVRTVISNADRSGAPEFDEIWDGKDDNKRQVANGPYFYQVVIENGEPIWGKILVLQ